MIKVAINGFGRIGRAFYKVAEGRDDMEVVAINDLGEKDHFAYLLKYDSVYGVFESKKFQNVQWIQEKDATKLPWGSLGIDIVVESTGLFTDYDKAKVHLDAGAKRVVISAPSKGDESLGATVLMGLNTDKMGACKITSNASCTTNASSPLIAILDAAIGIEKAVLNTTHAYTATQALVDGPSKKGVREGRAAALNIIPSSTGAAIAVTKAYTALENKFDGISLRVPVPAGSMADITFIAKRATTVEEVNDALRAAAKDPRWQGIFDATDEELVSSDIVGNPHAAIADLTMTRVVGGNLVKVLSWYDNEMGYTNALVSHVAEAGKHLA